jgi:uncharacterized protein YciI
MLRAWWNRCVYFLVLLHEPASVPDIEVDHESFVDSLVKRNVILLGGPLPASSEPGIWAGYVLSCASRGDAQAIVASDPLVTHGLAVATVTTWDLVAINTAAIASELAITPDDVEAPAPDNC